MTRILTGYSPKKMEIPGPEFTHWKGKKILETNFYMDTETYQLVLEDGTSVKVSRRDLMTDSLEGIIEKRGHTEEEFQEIKKSFEDTIRKLTKTYEEKLEHERKLRAEYKERNEYLQNEILDLRGELQRRDEQDRTSPVVYTGGLSDLPSTTIGTAIPTRWTYPSIGGEYKGDDSV